MYYNAKAVAITQAGQVYWPDHFYGKKSCDPHAPGA